MAIEVLAISLPEHTTTVGETMEPSHLPPVKAGAVCAQCHRFLVMLYVHLGFRRAISEFFWIKTTVIHWVYWADGRISRPGFGG